MKTTELFVEPVLIGYAVLLATAAMLSPDLVESLLRTDAGSLAAAVVAAYFAGVVFDRFSDSLLANLEHHHRLQFALKRLENEAPEIADDPFNEAEFRIEVLLEEQASEYAYYLRSRIRLTRALLALTPLAVVAAVIHLSEGLEPWHRYVAVAGTVAAYAIAFVQSQRQEARLPRTTGLLSGATRLEYEQAAGKAKPLHRFMMRNERLTWICAAMVLLAGFLAILSERAALGLVVIPATIAIALLAWSWWRINATFYRFLSDFHRVKRSASASAV